MRHFRNFEKFWTLIEDHQGLNFPFSMSFSTRFHYQVQALSMLQAGIFKWPLWPKTKNCMIWFVSGVNTFQAEKLLFRQILHRVLRIGMLQAGVHGPGAPFHGAPKYVTFINLVDKHKILLFFDNFFALFLRMYSTLWGAPHWSCDVTEYFSKWNVPFFINHLESNEAN